MTALSPLLCFVALPVAPARVVRALIARMLCVLRLYGIATGGLDAGLGLSLRLWLRRELSACVPVETSVTVARSHAAGAAPGIQRTRYPNYRRRNTVRYVTTQRYLALATNSVARPNVDSERPSTAAGTTATAPDAALHDDSTGPTRGAVSPIAPPPILPPTRRCIARPAIEIAGWVSVIAHRNTQDEQRNGRRQHHQLWHVVPSTGLPAIPLVYPVLTIVEKVVGTQLRCVIDRIVQHLNQRRIGRQIDADTDTGGRDAHADLCLC